MKKIKILIFLSVLYFCALTLYCNRNNIFERSTTKTNESKNKENKKKTKKKSETMIPINIIINSNIYTAKLYNSEASNELIKKMPFAIKMDDMNEQEKYSKMPKSITNISNEKPNTFKQGEIVIWNTDTLVIFYKTYPNNYSGYNRLGYIENYGNLKNDLGSGSANITIKLVN